ncbi:MAG: hypothetical protein KC621_23810, partial [Myxococcales bacterium]|nr:hypothetical protein [Myxococcales bacterium]
GRTLFEQATVELEPGRTLVLLITGIRAPAIDPVATSELEARLDREHRAALDTQAREGWLDAIAGALDLEVDEGEVDADLFERWAQTEGLAFALLRADDDELRASWDAWRADPGLRMLAAARARRAALASSWADRSR